MQLLAQINMGFLRFHRLRLNKNGDESTNHSGDDGYLLLEESKPELKKPSLYKVMMMNDDYTPMEFVVHVLQTFFSMDKEKAMRVMLQVHKDGKANCGVFTRDIAETKAEQIIDYAKQNEHPLQCVIEAIDDE